MRAGLKWESWKQLIYNYYNHISVSMNWDYAFKYEYKHISMDLLFPPAQDYFLVIIQFTSLVLQHLTRRLLIPGDVWDTKALCLLLTHVRLLERCPWSGFELLIFCFKAKAAATSITVSKCKSVADRRRNPIWKWRKRSECHGRMDCIKHEPLPDITLRMGKAKIFCQIQLNKTVD